MEVLRGNSGALHHFAKVRKGPRGREVTERFSGEIGVLDVIVARAKAFDVDARSVVLVGSSCSAGALTLAREYGFRVAVG